MIGVLEYLSNMLVFKNWKEWKICQIFPDHVIFVTKNRSNNSET